MIYFVKTVECLITGTRMEQRLYTKCLNMSSRLFNHWDKDRAEIIYKLNVKTCTVDCLMTGTRMEQG